MSLTLGDNFSYNGAKPLDARLTYSNLAEMKSKADSTLYEGCLAYCIATDKTYQWKSTNTVDENTGKWREFKFPTKTSDLTNDSGFIDNTVSNLVNYYTNQQTYTQAEVQALISAAASGGFEVVASLPAEGDAHTIYLVLKSPAGETGDIYDEYIYINDAWEHIGSTSIDLTQYQTKALVNSITVGGVEQTTVEGTLAALNALFASYMTTAAFNTAIADYYTKTQADGLFNSKADKVSSATSGHFAGLDANGNLTDSGKGASDFVTPTQLAAKQDALTAGNGINISNNAISTDNMPSTDMSEIVTPLPGVMSRSRKFSLDEQIIGEWVDGKKLYQICVATSGAVPTGGTLIYRCAMTGYDTLLYTRN